MNELEPARLQQRFIQNLRLHEGVAVGEFQEEDIDIDQSLFFLSGYLDGSNPNSQTSMYFYISMMSY